MRLNEHQRQRRRRARCACASAAASAPASASRAAAAARARRLVRGVAIGGFEGGQMPLASPPAEARLQQVAPQGLQRDQRRRAAAGDRRQARSTAGKPVDVDALVAAGMCAAPKDGLRLLGSGEIKAKLSLTVNHASATAKAAIEKAGGSIKLIEKKVLAGRRGQAQEDGCQEGNAGTTKKPAGGQPLRNSLGARAGDRNDDRRSVCRAALPHPGRAPI